MGTAESFAGLASRIVWSNNPVQEPVSTDELRKYLRIDVSEEDSLLADLIRAARERLELEARVALVRKSGVLYLDSFPSTILLRILPVISVESVKYYDSAQVLTTVSSSLYWVDTNLVPPRIVPVTSTSWPASLSERPSPVEIAFTAGYTPSLCPPVAKQAIRMMAAHQYRYRGAGAPPQESAAMDFSFRAMMSSLDWGSYAE